MGFGVTEMEMETYGRSEGTSMSGYLRIIAGLWVASLAFGSGALAEPKPFPDFEARWVKPPPKGFKGPRITVQIEPKPQKKPAAKKGKAKGAAAKPDVSKAAQWFWERHSPLKAASKPGRLAGVLVSLTKSEAAGIPAPRLSQLQKLATNHNADLLRQTVGTRVSPALALAVIWVESGGRKAAVSKAGAQGLMQLMPATAKRFGVNDATNPSQNIKGGVAYLDSLLKTFDMDPILALAAYNAGENAVIRHKGVPPYRETREYVPRVMAAYAVARGLCITPPELISDGCVFRLPKK